MKVPTPPVGWLKRLFGRDRSPPPARATVEALTRPSASRTRPRRTLSARAWQRRKSRLRMARESRRRNR